MPELTPGPGRFTELGVGWFVDFALGQDVPQSENDLHLFLEKTIESAIATLGIEGAKTASSEEELAPILEQLDRYLADRHRAEFWVAQSLVYALQAQQGLSAKDADRAAFHVLRMEHARSMAFFYANLHSLVWRGYQALGASELRAALRTWDDNQDNSSESFWHGLFAAHPFLLTHLIPGAAVVVGERVYVGGKRLDNTGGNMADFLVSSKLSGSIVLLELKTPTTELLMSTEYRSGVYAPSRHLGGAVNQVLSYRRTLLDEWRTLLETAPTLNAIHPKCYVVAGLYRNEVAEDPARKRSLELYRNALHDVVIVTFDELFASAQGLLSVFEEAASSSPIPRS
jgi:hypothetical protein